MTHQPPPADWRPKRAGTESEPGSQTATGTPTPTAKAKVAQLPEPPPQKQREPRELGETTAGQGTPGNTTRQP